MNITCIWHGHNTLGESPLWDHRENALFWVDIYGCQLHRLRVEDGSYHSWTMPDKITSIGLKQGGGLVATFKSALVAIELPSGKITWLNELLKNADNLRFNEGKCDRQGRYWAGTMDIQGKEPTGVLYQFDHKAQAIARDADFAISNGIGWSPDNHTMYFTDTIARKIFQYDFDPESGCLSNRRLFATTPTDAGLPDGLAVDSQGDLWSAHSYGWRITRYAPDGSIKEVIPMPISRPTSCCFGGKNLNILYVTSARGNLSEADLLRGPDAGGLFAMTTEVTGISETCYTYKS
ncbi:MAG TPA: SMP-30/gluconolactonase/LRE family protein [Gammaproteobacteria bacterium]|nr:SMP-30/gluconolactonase/LRE family protein [Gammaproteobacteria bacterium]